MRHLSMEIGRHSNYSMALFDHQPEAPARAVLCLYRSRQRADNPRGRPQCERVSTTGWWIWHQCARRADVATAPAKPQRAAGVARADDRRHRASKESTRRVDPRPMRAPLHHAGRDAIIATRHDHPVPKTEMLRCIPFLRQAMAGQMQCGPMAVRQRRVGRIRRGLPTATRATVHLLSRREEPMRMVLPTRAHRHEGVRPVELNDSRRHLSWRCPSPLRP